MNKLPEIPLSKQELEEFGVLQKRKKTGDLNPEDDLDALKRYKKIMSNYLKRLNGELGDVKKKAPEVSPKPADLPKATGGKEPWGMSKDKFIEENTSWKPSEKGAFGSSLSDVEGYVRKTLDRVEKKSVTVLKELDDGYKLVRDTDTLNSKKNGEFRIVKDVGDNVYESVGRYSYNEGLGGGLHFVLSKDVRGKGFAQEIIRIAEEQGFDVTKGSKKTRFFNKAIHRYEVEKALAEGKIDSHPDYPDLKAKSGK